MPSVAEYIYMHRRLGPCDKWGFFCVSHVKGQVAVREIALPRISKEVSRGRNQSLGISPVSQASFPRQMG